MEGNEELLRRARDVRDQAYAPYSGYRVGAALRASDGSVHVGCNVENASYGVTMCAERVALGAAVAAGRRAFRALAVSVDGGAPAPPCGACRQALIEFSRDLQVVSEAPGGRSEWSLATLLPEPFEGGATGGEGRGRGTRSPGGSLVDP